MKKILIICFILIFSFNIIGCKENTEPDQDLSSGTSSVSQEIIDENLPQTKQQNALLEKASEKSYKWLISKSYHQEDLLKNSFYGSSPNINETLIHLNERAPVQCLRNFNDTLPYCIYKLKEGGKLFIFFSNTGLLQAYNVFVVKDKLSKSDFENLKKGDTLASVEEIDKGITVVNSTMNEYILSNTNKTYHMVEEGFIFIRYNNALNGNSDDVKIESIDFIPNGGQLEPIDVEMYKMYEVVVNSDGEISAPDPKGFKYYFLPKDY